MNSCPGRCRTWCFDCMHGSQLNLWLWRWLLQIIGCGNSSGHILLIYDKTPGFTPFFFFFFCIKILIQLTWYHSTDMIQLTFTLKMTTTQVVETSVTVNNNSPIQDYIHPDDHPQPPYKMTFRFKPFPALKFSVSWNMHTLQLLWNLSLTDKHFLEKKKNVYNFPIK